MGAHEAGTPARERHHVQTAVVLAAVGLLSACGGTDPRLPEVTPPTSPVIQTVEEFRVTGYVTDTAIRPLGGARVEVADGPKAGTVTVTDETGRFSMPGTFTGTVTFVASKDGYLRDSRTVPPRTPLTPPTTGGNWQLALYLEPIGSFPDIAGEYTLTLTADAACTNLPAEARTRTYSATIAPVSASRTRLRATLSGAKFASTHNWAFVTTAGDFAVITICVPDPGQNDCLPGIVEELRATTYIAIEGGGEGTFDAAGITVPFSGTFQYCSGEVILTRDQYQCLASAPGQCESANHRLTAVRR